DYPVGDVECRGRDRDAERPGRLEVDDQLELGRLLDGNLAWLRAAQQPHELPSHYVSVELDDRWTISQEAALGGHLWPLVDGRQAVSRYALKNDVTIIEEQCRRQHVQRFGVRTLGRIDCRPDFLGGGNPMN